MLEDLLREAAMSHGVDVGTFKKMIAAESSGNPNAVSPKGAVGLGQLMPGTAREMGVSDPTDPRQNANAAAGYLSKMLQMHGGDYAKALTAYNWGPGNLARAGGVVGAAPSETQAYVARIMGNGGTPQPGPMSAAPPGAGAGSPPAAPGVMPAAQPPPPSQLTNQQQLLANSLSPETADRGTLASLMMGFPGASPGAPAVKPRSVSMAPGFGIG